MKLSRNTTILFLFLYSILSADPRDFNENVNSGSNGPVIRRGGLISMALLNAVLYKRYRTSFLDSISAMNKLYIYVTKDFINSAKIQNQAYIYYAQSYFQIKYLSSNNFISFEEIRNKTVVEQVEFLKKKYRDNPIFHSMNLDFERYRNFSEISNALKSKKRISESNVSEITKLLKSLPSTNEQVSSWLDFVKKYNKAVTLLHDKSELEKMVQKAKGNLFSVPPKLLREMMFTKKGFYSFVTSVDDMKEQAKGFLYSKKLMLPYSSSRGDKFVNSMDDIYVKMDEFKTITRFIDKQKETLRLMSIVSFVKSALTVAAIAEIGWFLYSLFPKDDIWSDPYALRYNTKGFEIPFVNISDETHKRVVEVIDSGVSESVRDEIRKAMGKL